MILIAKRNGERLDLVVEGAVVERLDRDAAVRLRVELDDFLKTVDVHVLPSGMERVSIWDVSHGGEYEGHVVKFADGTECTGPIFGRRA